MLVVDDADGDLLVPSYDATEAEAVAAFVDQIVSDRLAQTACYATPTSTISPSELGAGTGKPSSAYPVDSTSPKG